MSNAGVGELLSKVRSGDAAAAEELVRSYEPELRRAIRVRLTDARLRRLVDSMDICQSVLAGFFVRTAAGQYDIQSAEELLKLLVTMARNRVIDWVRRANVERRDGRREVPRPTSGQRTPNGKRSFRPCVPKRSLGTREKSPFESLTRTGLFVGGANAVGSSGDSPRTDRNGENRVRCRFRPSGG